MTNQPAGELDRDALLDLLGEHSLHDLWNREGRYEGSTCACGEPVVTRAMVQTPGGWDGHAAWRYHLVTVLDAAGWCNATG